ncbi:DUF6281 family protein [Streptomyces polyrhachis]|uniref:DUF6281 family protein n=1 Tax=Streptomyces polyrhachis TaxID=1282885 RepID=A0ABW2GHH4_9ACTN
MSRSGRQLSAVLLTIAAAAPLAACATAESGGGEASCVLQYTFEGRTYTDAGGEADFTVGAELGTAVKPPCEDTGGADPAEQPTKETAYRVAGVSPQVAVAVGTSPQDAQLVAVRTDGEVPPEVRKLLDGS